MKEKLSITFKSLIPYIAVIIVVLIIKMYIVTPVAVKGTSMDPTLKENDIMLLNEIGYKLTGLKRFDIVVINKHGEKLIKRIIGLPGEIIKYEDNKLYVNGNYVREDFLDESKTTQNFQVKLEEDYYFVLGDNRNVSQDSRYFGAVNIKDILGTTSLTIYPFDRLGFKN